MQREGRKGLNYLRRANLGEAPCLQKILLLTYGRIGRRKHVLLQDLLRPDNPSLELDDPAPLHHLYYSKMRCLSFFDTPKKRNNTHYHIEISDRYSRLKTAIKSQCQAGVALGRELKKPYLRTPINNVWERPMPIKRARNDVKRWYADTMTHLLPPLPPSEWDHIQAMIEGKKWFSFVKRRRPAADSTSHSGQGDQQFGDLVQEALALNKPSRGDCSADIDRPHNLNTRFMRRLYAKVLAYCCKLEWKEEHEKWKATWGTGLAGLNSSTSSVSTDTDLFAGVDAKGHILREPRPKTTERTPEEKKKRRQNFTIIPFYVDFLPKTHPIRKEADVFRQQQRAQWASANESGASAS